MLVVSSPFSAREYPSLSDRLLLEDVLSMGGGFTERFALIRPRRFTCESERRSPADRQVDGNRVRIEDRDSIDVASGQDIARIEPGVTCVVTEDAKLSGSIGGRAAFGWQPVPTAARTDRPLHREQQPASRPRYMERSPPNCHATTEAFRHPPCCSRSPDPEHRPR